MICRRTLSEFAFILTRCDSGAGRSLVLTESHETASKFARSPTRQAYVRKLLLLQQRQGTIRLPMRNARAHAPSGRKYSHLPGTWIVTVVSFARSARFARSTNCRENLSTTTTSHMHTHTPFRSACAKWKEMRQPAFQDVARYCRTIREPTIERSRNPSAVLASRCL